MSVTPININQQSLAQRLQTIAPFIGNTPLYPIKQAFTKKGVRIYAKLEWQQLGGSVKARAAFNIFTHAIQQGLLDNGKHLLDATSGNTGIAYASVGAALGIPVTLCLPENASKERKQILRSLGANIVYTSRFGGTDEAQEKAKELAQQYPDKYYYADQYANPNNWQAHVKNTAPEIYQQTQGSITHFAAGLGTTGTFVGTSRGLKKLNTNIHLTSLQPETALHGLEGWKHLETAVVPKIYDNTIAHQHLEIGTMDAYNMIKHFARAEGLLLSPSAAANLVGAIQVAEQITEGVIVTMFPDNADKYGEVLKQLYI